MNAEPAWVHNDQGERSAAIVNIDNGKYIAVVAVCAVICGLSGAVAWWAATSYREDSLEIQDEYQKVRNHVIELEARQKALADQLQELSHERR